MQPPVSPAIDLWRGPRWTLALLLAALGMVGPFAVDTYLPAFGGIAATLQATPLQLQQTLSAYLAGFAVMNLFHGALADSFGRRPVVLAGVALFTLASAGCALAPSTPVLIAFRALQGLSSGAGIVVSRAIVRDVCAPVDAQRMMSQVTIWFGIAPAVAPLFGGLLFDAFGWRSIFWLLTALGALLWAVCARALPETLPPPYRQPFAPRPLLRGYAQLASSARFLALTVAGGVPFNGMFLYVLSAPVFLGEHLRLAPTQFFWFFVANIAGIMAGAWLSGRLAGRMTPRRQVRWGYTVMVAVAAANVALAAALPPHPAWSIAPIAIYALGWAMLTPVVTLLVLDLVPERRGMAASVQASLGSAVNAVVAGAIAPLVMHSTLALALTSLAFGVLGLVCWTWVKRRLPQAAVHSSR